MIYTFYSYKGGVGRSMAMANVAEWLYQQGLRVVMIDWDLEAPGLETFFYSAPTELDVVRSQLGLIDLLLSYKRAFPRLQSEAKTRSEASQSEVGISDDENFLLTLRDSKSLPPICDALYPIHPPGGDEKSAALWLMPAGWRSGDRFPVYAHAVQSFDWADFYASYEGEAYFNWMREQLAASTLADVVLIDSRTGVTEMGGVCTRQMADVVVSFCVPNAQNLSGVATMAESFKKSEIISKRNRELDVLIVPTRIDMYELDLRKKFEDQFRQQLDKFIPASFSLVKSDFWELQIQYVSKYAYSEELAINDPSAPELYKAYKKLAAHLALLAQGTTGLQIRSAMTTELWNEFGDRLPSVFISAVGRAGEQVARQLRARLLEQKIALWPDLSETKGTGDLWQRTIEILDQAKAMVLVITPDAIHSELARRQWRYARQRGVNVYLVTTSPDAVSSPDLPQWLQTAQYFNAETEAKKLASVLQRPLPVTRVPFMAPDVIEGYVQRPLVLKDLKDALLANSDKSSARQSTVALCGAAGCGKTTTAIALCHDEVVDSFFEDGILWVSLGEDPDLLVELTKLYASLTGERPAFIDKDEAARAVAGKLSGKHFLLVLRDVVKAEHLSHFAFRDNRCVRLITTRDLNIAFGSDARVIQIREMTDSESLQLLAAGVENRADIQRDVQELAKRLDHWPLGLKIANAQLKKQVQLRQDPSAGVKSLIDDFDARGVSVLDTSSDGKGLISEKLNSALEQALPLKEDYDRFLQLAFFPANAVITLKDVSDLWGLTASETENRVQHLRDLSLLDYDASAKTIRLPSIMRSYLIGKMPDQDQLDDKLEAAFVHFTPAQQIAARRVLTRLVRLKNQGEDEDDTRQRAKLSELDPSSLSTIDLLATAKLVSVEQDQSGGTVQIASEAYLKGWKRLHNWIEQDREFLLWRQQLKSKILEWENTNRDQGALLSGLPLTVAISWRDQRRDELNASEQAFIEESVAELKRFEQLRVHGQRRSRRTAAAVFLVLLVIAAIPSIKYFRQRQAEEQQRIAREAARMKAEGLNNSGVVELGNDNYDAAIAAFNEATKAKPDYADAYLNRARAYDGKNEIETAIADYGWAIKISPDLAVAYFERGNLYYYNEDVDKAIADYTSAIKIKPDYWNAYMQRGFSYQDQSNNDAAIADFTQIIQSSSDQLKPRAYLYRGSTYLKKGDKDSAADDLLKSTALSADPLVRSRADMELIKINYPPLPQNNQPTVPIIFLQYNDARDSALVESVATRLQQNGFQVQPRNQSSVITDSDVFYYSPLFRVYAERIGTIVADTLASESKSNQRTDFRLENRGNVYRYVPRETIDVWIPSLQKSAASLAQPRNLSADTSPNVSSTNASPKRFTKPKSPAARAPRKRKSALK